MADRFLMYPFLKKQTITSYYGAHHGLDYGASIGTVVYAGCDGTVTTKEITEGGSSGNGKYFAANGEPLRSYGRVVYLTTGNYKIIYAHLDSFLVASGTKVKKGDPIGKSGNTGNSSGAHLHFEVQYNGQQRDPGKLLDGTMPDGSTFIPTESYVAGNDTTSEGPGAPQFLGTPIELTKYKGKAQIKTNGKEKIKILVLPEKGSKSKFWAFDGEQFDYMGKKGNYYYGRITGMCQAKVRGFIHKDNLTKGTRTKVDKKITVYVFEDDDLKTSPVIQQGFSTNASSNSSTGSGNGTVIEIGKGYGIFATREFSTSGYKNFNWASGTTQRRVWQAWKDKRSPTTNGFASIDGKILIACTTKFGKVGDEIIWTFSDGSTLDSIVGDIKNQNDPGCNEYGHNNGKCVLEFCGVPTGIKGYNNPYLYFGWTKVNKAENRGKYV